MGVVMSGGCGEFALVPLQLLLLIFHLPSPALSNVSTLERCVYRSQVNQSQSHDIICSSSHLHGSTYYHKMDESGMPRAANMDMIHCEAVSRGYKHLSLYELYTPRDGIIESLIPSGACVISDRGANCTQVILYVNLTYYNQQNDSIIPVCALTKSNNPNLECFCIRYLTLGSTPDCCDSERCKSVTTEAMMKNATTIKTEPQTAQPTNGCPAVAGRVAAATFQGTISVLIIIVIVLLAIVTIIVGAICIRKKSIRIRQPVTRSNSTSGQVRYFRSSSQQCKTVESDNGEPVDDDEHEIERDPFGIHEERHTLLNRSISCPAGSPTAIDPDGFNY